ncbi:pentapeptide repeat-containing protein [Oscillatoria sp. FACHB-1407]|uniref:pentapeptide repeat-containing protein n=1 Tax=Oscillatoria sp. FACHB-1407 TaxID=2692847 RepID=UPI0016862221|nr:pentapeptide repeat-containing protein [Oscillatoria sp. FACHB-1407]MBD2465871.1 pentapeptide repeat-containing protein [Oscillatoria sp. FACHB-1407]
MPSPSSRFKVLSRFRTPLVIAAVAIAVLTVLFQVGKQFEWTGFGEDETTTTVKSPVSATPDANGYVERTVTITPQSGKTLWDILSLIGVPASLALLGWWLQKLQEQRLAKQAEQEKEIAQQEKEIAQAHQNEEALQGFIDWLSQLLIEKNLIAIATKVQDQIKISKTRLEPDVTTPTAVVNPLPSAVTEAEQELLDAARDLIRARTLSIFRRLGDDLKHKAAAIKFLADSNVIERVGLDLGAIDLSGIDLRGANLRNINLERANLSHANLSHTNLSYAYLSRANLTHTVLNHTDLTGANFRLTNLSNTNLTGANLTDAYLRETDLTGANLTDAKLRSAHFSDANLSNANLSNADLSKAHLLHAQNLTIIQLRSALLCQTRLPEQYSVLCDYDCEKLRLKALSEFKEL